MRRILVVALEKEPDMSVQDFLALETLDVLALGEIIYEDFVPSGAELDVAVDGELGAGARGARPRPSDEN